MQKVKISITCLLCGNEISKEIPYVENDEKSLIEIFKDDCYQLQVLDMECKGEGLVLLYGLICKKCFENLKTE